MNAGAMNGIETVDKSALAQQFSAAADRYEEWATAQAEIAARLARRLPAQSAPSLIIDLGCGTGLLSAHLLRLYSKASLIGIDLAGGMVEHCRRRFATAAPTRARFVSGDVEDRQAVIEGAGLIASSCVAQWFSDTASTLCMWSQALAPGGLMAFACLLRGSFCELEKAYLEAIGCRFPGLNLPDRGDLPQLFLSCGMRLLCREEDAVSARYPSSRAALRSFQEIGADFHGQPGHRTLGPAALRRLLACYDRHSDAQGTVPVTYRVQYVIAERGR